MTDSRLTVIATEAGAHVTQSERFQWHLRADLADIRLWRFFDASPDEFFTQYADHCVIDHFHLGRNTLDKALEHLVHHPERRLTLSGPLSAAQRRALQTACRDANVSLAIVALAAPRVLHYQDGVFWSRGAMPQALKQAGIAMTTHSPAHYWAQWYRRFTIEEVIAELRVRDPSVFFNFLKTLTDYTARGINWQAIAVAAGITGPTAKHWGLFLERIGLIDLIEPVAAPAPRRSSSRAKLYWTSPGLALWLSDAMMHLPHDVQSAYMENAVYLALKDALPEAEFGHFADTNKVQAPLLVRTTSDKSWRMYGVALDSESVERLAKHHASLERLGLVDALVRCVSTGPLDDAFPLPESVRRVAIRPAT